MAKAQAKAKKATVNWAGGYHDIEYDGVSEESLWKQVGEIIGDPAHLIVVPDLVSVITEDNAQADILVTEPEDQPGKRIFQLKGNNIKLKKSLYLPIMLRYVDPETNRRSFYDFVPNNMGPITVDVGARFGKIGEKGMDLIEEGDVLRKPFPSCLYWTKVYAKLSEGYTDETENLYDDSDDPVEQMFHIDEPVSDEADDAIRLYEELLQGAKAALSDFNVDFISARSPYTGKQIASCKKVYAKLTQAANLDVAALSEHDGAKAIVDAANAEIIQLIKIANPTFKKGVTVKSFMIDYVGTKAEAQKAVYDASDEWEAKINAMDAVSVTSKPKSKVVSPFGNVEVRKATEDEFMHYQDLIREEAPEEVHQLMEVYMLNPHDRRQAYEDALEKAANKTEMELFHGSRTANMISLIGAGGPTINVDAANGRAYGNGSYWSHHFVKSRNYTDYLGSRWANGSSDIAYMLVGKVHYGKPYFPDGVYHAEEAVKKGGYDVCHAKPEASGFRWDEIITYDEAHSYVCAILKFGDAEEEDEDNE